MTTTVLRPSYGLRPHQPNALLALPQTFGWSAAQLQCAREIMVIAEVARREWKGHVPDLAMLSGVLQECSLDSGAIGDNGHSRGPFQIYDVAHQGYYERPLDPFSNYAYFNICFKPWEDAWAALDGDAIWQTLSARGPLLERFIPRAQGSVPWVSGLGQLRYTEAVSILELIS